MRILNYPAIPITAFAVVLMVPAMLSSPMTHDSFWISWVWTDQFTAELARGNLYPRWLPQSHGGLGSPVFYYYPPLAFYMTGVFGLTGLTTYAAIMAAFFAALLASGFAMHAWLKGAAKAPLAGALIYMAAPYHLLDFYGRGALAEFAAIALIPVLALGMRRVAEGRVVLAAIAFAALILTHLPLALLVSIFFAAPYAIYTSWRSPGRLLRHGGALLLGMALSSIYLLPALVLEPYRDAAQLWTDPSVQPENWSVLAWHVAGPSPGMKAAFIALLIAMVPISALLIASRTARYWGLYSAACLIVAAGLIPGLWRLPLIEAVQYPFRLLPLAEFAIATGLARVGFSRTAALLAISPAVALSIYFAAVHKEAGEFTIGELAAAYPDVPENLPPGDRPFSWPSDWALALSRSHQQSEKVGSGYLVEPVFYFPAWKVDCQSRLVPTAPEPETKLLVHQGAAGCVRYLAPTDVETIGAGISFLGLLLLLLFSARNPFCASRQAAASRKQNRCGAGTA